MFLFHCNMHHKFQHNDSVADAPFGHLRDLQTEDNLYAIAQAVVDDPQREKIIKVGSHHIEHIP